MAATCGPPSKRTRSWAHWQSTAGPGKALLPLLLQRARRRTLAAKGKHSGRAALQRQFPAQAAANDPCGSSLRAAHWPPTGSAVDEKLVGMLAKHGGRGQSFTAAATAESTSGRGQAWRTMLGARSDDPGLARALRVGESDPWCTGSDSLNIAGRANRRALEHSPRTWRALLPGTLAMTEAGQARRTTPAGCPV